MAKKRKRLVPVIVSDQFVDFRTPRRAADVKVTAEAIHDWNVRMVAWREKCRAISTEGNGKTFPACPKAPNPNRGLLTQPQFDKWKETYNAGEEVEEVFAAYQPVIVQLAADAGMTGVYHGQAAKHKNQPKDWKKEYGEFRPGDFLAGPGCKAQIRICHARDVRRLVDDRKENVVTIGSREYAVGTGGADGSVVKITCAQSSGTYEAVSVQRMFESTARLPGLANLVAQINNSVTTIELVDGIEVVFLPNQLMTLGYLVENGKPLSPAQVRKIAEEGSKAPKFEPIKENNPAMRGTVIQWSDLWKATQAELGQSGVATLAARKGRSGKKGDARNKAFVNAGVTLRIHPEAHFCFGIAAMQIHSVPFLVCSNDADMKTGKGCGHGVAIGYRTNVDLNVTVREAKRATTAKPDKPVKTTKPKSEKKTAVPKPKVVKKAAAKADNSKKTAKAKTVKKATIKGKGNGNGKKAASTKAKKPATPKPTQPSTAAAAIEHDTADESTVDVDVDVDADAITPPVGEDVSIASPASGD